MLPQRSALLHRNRATMFSPADTKGSFLPLHLLLSRAVFVDMEYKQVYPASTQEEACVSCGRVKLHLNRLQLFVFLVCIFPLFLRFAPDGPLLSLTGVFFVVAAPKATVLDSFSNGNEDGAVQQQGE